MEPFAMAQMAVGQLSNVPPGLLLFGLVIFLAAGVFSQWQGGWKGKRW